MGSILFALVVVAVVALAYWAYRRGAAPETRPGVDPGCRTPAPRRAGPPPAGGPPFLWLLSPNGDPPRIEVGLAYHNAAAGPASGVWAGAPFLVRGGPGWF